MTGFDADNISFQSSEGDKLERKDDSEQAPLRRPPRGPASEAALEDGEYRARARQKPWPRQGRAKGSHSDFVSVCSCDTTFLIPSARTFQCTSILRTRTAPRTRQGICRGAPDVRPHLHVQVHSGRRAEVSPIKWCSSILCLKFMNALLKLCKYLSSVGAPTTVYSGRWLVPSLSVTWPIYRRYRKGKLPLLNLVGLLLIDIR